MAEKMVTGVVKWFSARRGYGFITDVDGVDYFVHFSEIQTEGFKKLRADQKVLFQKNEDDNGRGLAKCIQPLSEENEKVEEEPLEEEPLAEEPLAEE